MNTPSKYLTGVDKTQRLKELEQRRTSKKPTSQLFPKKTDKEAIEKKQVRQSPFTTQFKKIYGDVPFDLPAFSKKFNIPLANLKEVYEKGIGAWKSSGSRPGVPAEAWAIARVYKFILIQQGKLPEPKRDPDAYLRKK
jgi:hypothetical protein